MFTKYEELIKTPEYWLDVIQNEIFRQVHSYMQKENLNQSQLAEKLGVSKGYISQILNGNCNFTLKKLTELEKASGAAEKKYEESPDDIKAEIEFDKAYKKEFEMYMLVSSEIAVFFTIENALARKMVKTKRKELISLL